MRHLALTALVWVASPSAAVADRDEASVHVQAVAGLAAVEDPVAGTDRQLVGAGGVSVRATIGTRDWLAWEVEGYALVAGASAHRGIAFEGDIGDVSRRATALGAELGATARLGVEMIPTASLAIGPQVRMLPKATVVESGTGEVLGDIEAVTELDLTVRVSVGIDLRLHPRWIVGLRASGRQALGLGDGAWQSAEVALWAGYYWYHGWWGF